MRNYKKTMIETNELESITCSCCKKLITPADYINWQELAEIEFVAGYGSVFGDGSRVSCHICMNCLVFRLGDVLEIEEDE
jgi:hypothetical protein